MGAASPNKDFPVMIREAMTVLQDCVKSGRKVKSETGMSLKEHPFAVSFKIPFALLFSLKRDDNSEIVRRMLKAENVYMEEDGFDGPFASSETAEKYPYFAGECESGQVKSRLWTQEPLWQ